MRRLCLALPLLVLAGGCRLTALKQQCIEWQQQEMSDAVEEVVVVAEEVSAISTEIEAALAEERPPMIEPRISRIAQSLDTIASKCVETGKTADSLQKCYGRSVDGPPRDGDEAQKLRSELELLSSQINAAKAWIRPMLPVKHQPAGISDGMSIRPNTLGAIAGMLVPGGYALWQMLRAKRAKADIGGLNRAVQQYYTAVERMPERLRPLLEDLVAGSKSIEDVQRAAKRAVQLGPEAHKVFAEIELSREMATRNVLSGAA